MEQNFGNIPEEVLYLTIRDFDDEDKTLKEVICEVTDQDILKAKFIVGTDHVGDPFIYSFVAWTEDYVLTLISGVLGHHLLCSERNPEVD